MTNKAILTNQIIIGFISIIFTLLFLPEIKVEPIIIGAIGIYSISLFEKNNL